MLESNLRRVRNIQASGTLAITLASRLVVRTGLSLCRSLSVSLTLLVGLTSLASAASSVAKPVAGVNYDDPNLATTNDFVSDSVTTCSASLRGKALDECLVRTGLKSSDVAQAQVLDIDTTPLSHRRTGSAR